MPSIAEGEWDLYTLISNLIVITFVIILFIACAVYIIPKVLDGAEMMICGMPCGCGDNSQLQHNVKHFIAENKTLYAELCDGTVMEVKGFENHG